MLNLKFYIDIYILIDYINTEKTAREYRGNKIGFILFHKSAIKLETFEKCSFLFKFKEG